MLALLVFAVAVAAVPPASTAPTKAPTGLGATPTVAVKAPVAVASDDNVKVCESDQDTGSLFSHRTCHTKAEWRQLHAQAHEMLEDTYQRGSTASFTGGH